ncbi:hypothetical protein U8L64_02325 [Pseudomonas sp. FIP_A4]|uniref:O-antigen ligase family protein n=1 Tax=Pseudomonas sp. FIP_A4 TaxID=3070684 RepID=UPI002FD0D367
MLQIFIGALVAICIFYKAPKVPLNSSLLALAFLVIIGFLYAMSGGYYESLFSLIAFALLVFFSFYIASNNLLAIERIKNIYVFCCVFVAGGLFFQVILHNFLDVIFFRHELFGGSRNAYSFIWMDYSFISLFVVSCMPIVWGYKNKLLSLCIIPFLLFASIATSARTGIAAVVLFLLALLTWEWGFSLVKGRVSFSQVLLTLFLIALPFMAMYALPVITGRQLSTSSSGRFEDFAKGFQFFLEHPWFGSLLNKEIYGSIVGAVPHNIFIFPLLMGGVVYFFAFMLFLILLIKDVRCADSSILASVLICFFGFQFIPSFFSSYFFAILLGVAMASAKLNNANYYRLMAK